MGITLILSSTADLILTLHQWPLLFTLLFLLSPLAPRSTPRLLTMMVFLPSHLHPLHRALVLVHSPQRLADAEEQHHEAPLGELVVVDEVRVDHILQVAALVVRQQHVDGLGGLVGTALSRNGVVDGGDDGRDVGEKSVGVDFAHRLLNGFGAKWTSDLFEGEELMGVGIFDKVNIGKAALQR